MQDLYTDADPEYRATQIDSGIPPPSERPHSLPSMPPPPAPQRPAFDMRISTDFIECSPDKRLDLDALISKMGVRPAETDLDFWSMTDLVQQVNGLRQKFTQVPREKYTLARARSNPFESIGKSIFMNRAATKLAALDATFAVIPDTGKQPLTFADICGGPGGFSEYILWRVHSWGGVAQGYGITLKAPPEHDEVNWHTEKFRRDAPANFVAIDGIDGTGDLYKEANMRHFAKIIRTATRGTGTDLAVADGGFDFTGKEGQQEHLARRLILCEIITMLLCLRKGGTFVCKFFDILEEFTGDLVWLLYQVFDTICITKPLSSRPANSERYIICKGLRFDKPDALVSALMRVNSHLEKAPESVGAFVSKGAFENDETFVDYVKMRNIRFATNQIQSLQLLEQHLLEPDRAPLFDQDFVRRQCLSEWRLPLYDQEQ